MKYKIRRTSQFKKDYKSIVKQNLDVSLLEEVVTLLVGGKPLPEKYNDHPLTGNLKGYRECHIKPDWLLIYLVEEAVLVLTLTRTGSHSDLF